MWMDEWDALNEASDVYRVYRVSFVALQQISFVAPLIHTFKTMYPKMKKTIHLQKLKGFFEFIILYYIIFIFENDLTYKFK